MKPYHKIPTVFKRNPATKHKTLLVGEYATPELEYLSNNEWVFTEKVDGTNIRVMFSGGKVRFGGRSENSQIPASLVSRLEDMFLPLLPTFLEICDDVSGLCLYGEGYGSEIQKGGGDYSPTQEFVLFDVQIGEWWLRRDDVHDIASKFGLDMVPVVGRGTLLDMVALGRGFLSKWGDFFAEGIVARPAVEVFTRKGDRIITKVKRKDFGKYAKVVQAEEEEE